MTDRVTIVVQRMIGGKVARAEASVELSAPADEWPNVAVRSQIFGREVLNVVGELDRFEAELIAQGRA